MRDCEFFNDMRVYVFRRVIKKRNIKIINDKYNKKLKKYYKYITNIEINIKNINSNENYVKKTVVLFKNAINKIFKFE